MIDHVTYQVRLDLIDSHRFEDFFNLIGFLEIVPEESVPPGWKVRWFKSEPTGDTVHIVAEPEGMVPALKLAHFAVWLGHHEYEMAKHSRFLARARPGSNRIWLECLGLRVEARST